MSKIGAAIVGGSGYTGVELIRILALHPYFEITSVSSRQYAGQPVASVFPSVQRFIDLNFIEPDPQVITKSAEAIFCALPHQTAMEIIPKLATDGRKVVDLSADFRFHDPELYAQWYHVHSCPDLLAQAVYGLPELHFDLIGKAFLVGNPGCYPTSVILGLAPLLKEKWIDLDTIIADSKSGVSGAGRGLALSSMYCEVNEGIKAYKIAEHRHTPEIEQELSLLAGKNVTISFTPHLVPMTRGILSTIYARLVHPATTDQVLDLYRNFYLKQPFVRIYSQGNLPGSSYVTGTNYADIGAKVDKRTNRVVIASAIDNLVKGASGQAVQNMNIMFGFDQTAGLAIAPLYP